MAREKKQNDAVAQPEPELSGALPLYRDARPVRAETHGDKGIAAGEGGFAFAAAAPLIPLTVDEFELAALDYPIAFVGAEKRAFAVTGLKADENLFVSGEAYRADAYVPAYLRRYPFVFARDAEDTMRILCLDEASDRVVAANAEGARPLFEDGEPTELTRHALAFCEQFDVAETRTATLVALLDELDLFVPQQAHINRPTSGDAAPSAEMLLDYLAIDRAKLEALPAEQLQRLAMLGALGPIYAQILSGRNWAKMTAKV